MTDTAMTTPRPNPTMTDPLRAALEHAEWLVYFARKSKGTVAEVAARALEQNPYLRDALAADTARPGLDATFLDDAATSMRERFDHGAAKFGRYSWREDGYADEDNLERLRRAVDHLEAARRNSEDPAEWRKRAADVANQAFMFADPARLTEDRP